MKVTVIIVNDATPDDAEKIIELARKVGDAVAAVTDGKSSGRPQERKPEHDITTPDGLRAALIDEYTRYSEKYGDEKPSDKQAGFLRRAVNERAEVAEAHEKLAELAFGMKWGELSKAHMLAISNLLTSRNADVQKRAVEGLRNLIKSETPHNEEFPF